MSGGVSTSGSKRSVRLLSIASGVLGATASCAAKLALSGDSELVSLISNFHFREERMRLLVEYTVRGMFLLIMIACNALMLGSFLEGMEESGSVAGTGLSSGANFVAAALFGYIVFGESFSQQWLIGFSMVLVGVAVLSSVKGDQKKA